MRFEVGGDILKVDSYGGQSPPLSTGEGSGGCWGPQQGTGAERHWGSRGKSPQKENEFNVLTLPRIAFLQRNSSKSRFLKRIVSMINQLFYLVTLSKFWSRWLIKNSRHAGGLSVTCNVTLKCYVTAERSPGNHSVHGVDFMMYWDIYFVVTFLGRKACNLEVRCFTFRIFTKEMNMLVRFVRFLNFWCHFVSEVAGDFRQSSWRWSLAAGH